MNYIVAFWLIILLQPIVSAQSDTTYYFTKKGAFCFKELADSYRKVKLEDSTLHRYSFEEYSIDSTLKSKGFFLRNNFSYKTGSYTYYYKNGNKQAKGTYLTDLSSNIIGVKINNWFYWYENGAIQVEQLNALDLAKRSSTSYIVNFWDTAGVKKVTDGNGNYTYIGEHKLPHDSTEKITFSGSIKDKYLDGTWKGFYEDGSLFCEETYTMGELTTGKSYDHKDKSYTYTKLQSNPEFIGGDVELIRFLQKHIQYPWREENNYKQGKVMVRFVVDETGQVKDAEITHSVSPGLDKEALRVVNKLPDFKPGLLRGQPASIYFNLPVVFKLQ